MKGRYLVAIGMFLLALLLYIDRICISVAKEPIATALNLSDKAMGWVLSAFALGYALFQIPSGALSDRYGPRRVLSGIVSIWSALTALTGLAWNLFSLLTIRFLFGAGEAGAFPGMSRAIFSWFPLRERGTVTGINFSGSRLGAAFALPMVAWMIETYSWRFTFYSLGLIGIIWAAIWWHFFRDTPEEIIKLPERERSYILANRQQSFGKDSSASLHWKKLYRSKNMQSAVVQYFASNFTFFFALTWLFPYIKETYDLASMEAGWYSVAPFIAGAAGNWLGGIRVDSVYRKGKWNASRIQPAVLGFALAAGGLIGSIFMSGPFGAVLMISIAILGADMTLPPSWALCVDIGKEQAGAVSGTMNMAGNIGSFLTALAFPYLTAWMGSTDYFFYMAAALNVVAIWMWWRVRADRGLEY
ncbi:MAG: MFS transporter [Saprospiraceae bacterium]|nr:MFS transporter [Lewinella sp.]